MSEINCDNDDDDDNNDNNNNNTRINISGTGIA
jgi:hypothetical protein